MSLLEHARTELEIAARDEDLAVEPPIADAMLKIIEGFAGQGHSGGSASIVGPRIGYVLRLLLAYEPITPLTGEDSEWLTISEDMMGRPGVEQNVRCGRVFREQGIAYDIEAVVFRDWRGPCSCVGWDSGRRITFPYTPTTRHTRFRRVSRTWARLRGTLRPS